MTVEETLAELVRLCSISARSNREIISYAAARVEALGLRVRLLPYADEHGVEKVNMLAAARRYLPRICFGHPKLVLEFCSVGSERSWEKRFG